MTAELIAAGHNPQEIRFSDALAFHAHFSEQQGQAGGGRSLGPSGGQSATPTPQPQTGSQSQSQGQSQPPARPKPQPPSKPAPRSRPDGREPHSRSSDQ